MPITFPRACSNEETLYMATSMLRARVCVCVCVCVCVSVLMAELDMTEYNSNFKPLYAVDGC